MTCARLQPGRRLGRAKLASASPPTVAVTSSVPVRSQDRVIAGGAEEIDLIDLWTFERDTRSSDPNWMLTATRSGA